MCHGVAHKKSQVRGNVPCVRKHIVWCRCRMAHRLPCVRRAKHRRINAFSWPTFRGFPRSPIKPNIFLLCRRQSKSDVCGRPFRLENTSLVAGNGAHRRARTPRHHAKHCDTHHITVHAYNSLCATPWHMRILMCHGVAHKKSQVRGNVPCVRKHIVWCRCRMAHRFPCVRRANHRRINAFSWPTFRGCPRSPIKKNIFLLCRRQ